MQFMVKILPKYYYGAKFIAYLILGIMICMQIIGPKGVTEFLKVKDPSEEGIDFIGILIPKYVLYWTLGTVALEVVGNLFSAFTFKKYDNEPITKSEFRDKMSERDTERFKSNLRIAKIESKLKL